MNFTHVDSPSGVAVKSLEMIVKSGQLVVSFLASSKLTSEERREGKREREGREGERERGRERGRRKAERELYLNTEFHQYKIVLHESREMLKYYYKKNKYMHEYIIYKIL